MKRAIGLLAVLVALPAHAERLLSYEDALSAAVQASPQLRQAQRNAEQTAADVTAAQGQFDPTFTLNGGYNTGRFANVSGEFNALFLSDVEGWNLTGGLNGTAPSGTSFDLETGVTRSLRTTSQQFLGADSPGTEFTLGQFDPVFRLTLGQELLRGVLTRFNLANVRQAKERRDQAALDLEAARQQALADVARAYWNWVYLAELSRIADRAVEVAVENLRVGVARVEAGEAAPVERTRLEAAMVQAESSAIEADQNAAQAGDALLLLMGRPPGEDITPGTGTGDVPEIDVDVDEALRQASQNAPQLLAQRARLEAARTALRDARHAMLPSLRANVSGTYRGSVPDESNFDFGDLVLPSLNVGGVLTVPLGNRANRGQRLRAEAEVVRQEDALDVLQGQVQADVAQQVRVIGSAAQRVRLADVNVRLARETLSAEEALYDVGRQLLKDVLEARNQLDSAEGEAIRARTDFRVAVVELRRLVGSLDQEGAVVE